MASLVLRPYQKECVDVINGLNKGSYLVTMATGLGKTVVMSMLERKGRTLILSHRDELVHQPIKYFDCPCGIEKGSVTSNGEEVVSASVQSMVRRLNKFNPDDFDLIITDEAHHAAAKTYRKIYDYFRPRLHIGFTATPNRFDRVRLDDIYSKIVFHRDLKWGIQNGYLCDIDCYQSDIGFNIANTKKNRGDFVEHHLAKELDQPVFNQRVADIYQNYAKGQTLIFCVNVHHAEEIAKLIPGAVALSGKTPLDVRKNVIEKFKNKEIPCLVNCMLFTEGTDIPNVETIIMARPTLNQGLYSQMVGRGLRLAPGKDKLILVDCVGITGKLKVCTAPCLFGLDPQVIPKNKRDQLQGALTDMEDLFESILDTPTSWIANAEKIELFSEEHSLEVHDVDWHYQKDSSLSCFIGDGKQLMITPVDELGLCKIVITETYSGDVLSGGAKSFAPQEALDVAYNWLIQSCGKTIHFWAKTRADQWGAKPCSDSQLEYIEKLKKKCKKLGTSIDLSLIDEDELNKRGAGIVIDRLLAEIRELEKKNPPSKKKWIPNVGWITVH